MDQGTSSSAASTSPGNTGVKPEHITTSTRDPLAVGRQLEGWLATVLPAGSSPTVTDVVSPEGNGMSSETLLFTAHWTEDGTRVERRCVARIEPPPTAHPVFTSYDLDLQYRVMGLVRDATDVPVPETLWYEDDPSVLGVTFFVMERIDGLVPPDVLPYTFGDNWVFDGTPEARERIQATAVEAMAGIHSITTATHDLGFLEYDLPGETPLARHVAHWRGYLDWVVQDDPSPLLADCFDWLEANLPADPAAALSWGDGRIGNMMFADNEVVAVLDWEMAAVAPPEVDLGWMLYLHMFFQDLAVELGAEGLPDMFLPADVAASYAKVSGHTPDDLRWHIAYAAMRHGVIMRRVTERSILFGEAERPADVDDLILHRKTLRAMLDDTYWASKGL